VVACPVEAFPKVSVRDPLGASQAERLSLSAPVPEVEVSKDFLQRIQKRFSSELHNSMSLSPCMIDSSMPCRSFFGTSSPLSSMFSQGMDDDDPMSGFSSGFSSMPGGFRSSARTSGGFGGGGARRSTAPPQQQSGPPPPEITRPLPVSLQDLYTGTTLHMKVSRKLLSGEAEEKVLDINVLPGWKSGTKIRFPKAGNEVRLDPATNEPVAPDLVFVVEDKEHPTIKREGNDLITTVKIPLVDALTNPPTPHSPSSLPRTVKHLDGRNLHIPRPLGVVKPRQTTRIPGEGMPIRSKGGGAGKGDFIINWEPVFPEVLSEERRQLVAKALKV
jgi:DnaJ family protein B protein 4